MMKHPRSSYLNEDWYDPITHEHFCAECHDILERRGEVIKDHVLGVWKHYGYVSFPGIKATDNLGRTIENKWDQPPRVAKVLIPIQSNLRFCKDCFPFTSEQIRQDLCGACLSAVEDEHEFSRVEFLWKHTNGYNGPFIQGVLHMECLPEHFSDLQAYRQYQKSKK